MDSKRILKEAKLLNDKKVAPKIDLELKNGELKEEFMSTIELMLDRNEEAKIPESCAVLYNDLVTEDEEGVETSTVEEVAKVVDKTETKPKAETKPKVEKEKKPKAEKKPKVEKKPKAPKAEKKPIGKETPKAEKKSNGKETPKAKVEKKPKADKFCVRKGSRAEKQLNLLMKAPIKMGEISKKTGDTCYALVKRMEKNGMKLTVTKDKEYFLETK